MWKREKNGDKEVLARNKLNEIKLNEASGEIMKAHPKATVRQCCFLLGGAIGIQPKGPEESEREELIDKTDISYHWPEGVAIPRSTGFNGMCMLKLIHCINYLTAQGIQKRGLSLSDPH